MNLLRRMMGRIGEEESAGSAIIRRAVLPALAAVVLIAALSRGSGPEVEAARRSAPARPEDCPSSTKLAPPSQPVRIVKAAEPRAATQSEVGKAIGDSALKALIDGYLQAWARRDAATRDAMLSGLKRNPDRSRELLLTRRGAAGSGGAAAIDEALSVLR